MKKLTLGVIGTSKKEDEKRAKILRDKHREVLERLVLEHLGQILQYYGDGTLAIFGSMHLNYAWIIV